MVVVGDVTDYCEIRWECLIQMIIWIEVEYAPTVLLPTASGGCDAFAQGEHQRSKVSRDNHNNIPNHNHNHNKSKRADGHNDKVTLHIYYLPDLRRGGKLSLRFLHKELNLTDHETALEFLSHLIRRQPQLQSEEIEEYFHKCGAILPSESQRTTLQASPSNMTLSSAHTSQGAASGYFSRPRTPHETTPRSQVTTSSALPGSGGSSGFTKLTTVLNRNMNTATQSPRSANDASYVNQQQQLTTAYPVPGSTLGLTPIIVPKVISHENINAETPRSIPQSPQSSPDIGGCGSAFKTRHNGGKHKVIGSPTTSEISTTAEKGDTIIFRKRPGVMLSPPRSGVSVLISDNAAKPTKVNSNQNVNDEDDRISR